MSKTYQAKHFTGEELDGFMQKVQSQELAGRGLEFDENGVLSCTVPGYTKKVFSYTHTTNKEVHVTEVDIATGVFTAVAHGLNNYQRILATVHYPYNIGTPYAYLPKGLSLGSTGNTSSSQSYYVHLIDEDHFAVGTTSTGGDVIYSENPTMDLSKFHFEVVEQTDFTIEGLDLRECLLVVQGKIYTSFRWVHPTTRIVFGDSGDKIGGISYDASFGVDVNGSCHFGRPGHNFVYATAEFKMIGPNQVYQVNNADYVMYSTAGAPSFRHNRQYYHLMLSSDTIEGITMYGDLGGGFFNGTTVEVYEK